MKIGLKQIIILKFFFIVIISGLVGYQYFQILNYRLINPDAGYYLWIVNKISEGKIPGIDINTIYLPLSFYLISVVNLFKDNPTYYNYLYILLFIQLLNALLLYYITKYYTANRFILSIVFILYLLISFHSDGSFFILEPFVNLFGLLSLLFYLKLKNHGAWFILIPGILGALSFFSKQYGIVYFFAVPILLIIDYKNISSVFKRMTVFALGYLIPFIAFLLFYIINGSSLHQVFEMYSGSGYGQRSFPAYLSGLFTLIKIYGIFLPFCFLALVKKGMRHHIIVYIYLLSGFSIQFFFNKFPHYYLLLIPHLILLAVLTYESLKGENKFMYPYIFFLLGTITINVYANFLTVRNFSGSDPILKENIETQIKNSELIKNNLGEEDKVLLYDFDLVTYYFFCKLNPPLERKYGIIYFGSVSLDQYLENLNNAEYILIRGESIPVFNKKFKSTNVKWEEIKISDNLFLLKKTHQLMSEKRTLTSSIIFLISS